MVLAFSQPPEISDFRLRREVIIPQISVQSTEGRQRRAGRKPVNFGSMFSQPPEISDFRLRREVIIPHSTDVLQ